MGNYDVLSERELESRYEVFVEQYIAKVNIEAETTFSMAKTMLLPAAIRYLVELGAAGESAGVAAISADVTGLVDAFVERIAALETANTSHPEIEDVLDKAKYVQTRRRPGHERGARDRRPARADRARLALAAAEVLGDPVHQVDRSHQGEKGEGPAHGGALAFRGDSSLPDRSAVGPHRVGSLWRMADGRDDRASKRDRAAGERDVRAAIRDGLVSHATMSEQEDNARSEARADREAAFADRRAAADDRRAAAEVRDAASRSGD